MLFFFFLLRTANELTQIWVGVNTIKCSYSCHNVFTCERLTQEHGSSLSFYRYKKILTETHTTKGEEKQRRRESATLYFILTSPLLRKMGREELGMKLTSQCFVLLHVNFSVELLTSVNFSYAFFDKFG